MTKNIAIHWFRQDLRILDNPALVNASRHQYVMPIYILDDINAKHYSMGSASRVWLHHSLISLNQSLEGNLSLYRGDPLVIIEKLISKFSINAIYWNRCYEPWRILRDKTIKSQLEEKICVETSNGSLLWEPWEIKKEDGTPYKVFTPFYRKGCLNSVKPRKPLATPENKNYFKDDETSLSVHTFNLLPTKNWQKKIEKHWRIGESSAHHHLEVFLKSGLPQYKLGRNSPAQRYVSRLSPHLHFGEVSPNQLWHDALALGNDDNIHHFCSELGWREFSYSQLYYFPELPTKNLQSKFDHFPWVDDSVLLSKWQQGKTGLPMVDAGMRELWQTGYMHNRVRMIVGSFLVKNLRLNWQHGERWFWDTLVDADLANNSASWQWVAGCGADAAPYFRIFNPVTQGQKFDAEGSYVRNFVPEIARLPNRYLFSPWEASRDLLKASGISLGEDYPYPITDLKISRAEALACFQSLPKVLHE